MGNTPLSKESQVAESSNKTAKEAFELYAKVGAFIVICLYLAGFLTVNKYLYQLGVSDFSLIQARFIYTGLLTLSFIVLDFVLIYTGISIAGMAALSQPLEKNNPKKIGFRLSRKNINVFGKIIGGELLIVLPWLISTYFVYASQCSPALTVTNFITSGIFGGQMFHPWILGNSLLFFILGSSIAFIAYLVITRTIGNIGKAGDFLKSWRGSLSNAVSSFILVLLALLLLNFYIGIFTKYVYPIVPEQFGGGPPKLVSFVFTDSAKKGAEELGIEFENGNLSKDQYLLFEGSDSYILSVYSPNGSIVRINKNMIQALRIVKLRGGGC